MIKDNNIADSYCIIAGFATPLYKLKIFMRSTCNGFYSMVGLGETRQSWNLIMFEYDRLLNF